MEDFEQLRRGPWVKRNGNNETSYETTQEGSGNINPSGFVESGAVTGDMIVSGTLKADRIGAVDATKGLFIFGDDTVGAFVADGLTVVASAPTIVTSPLNAGITSSSTLYLDGSASQAVLIAREPANYNGYARVAPDWNSLNQALVTITADRNGSDPTQLQLVSDSSLGNYSYFSGDANVIGYGVALSVNGYAVALFGHKHVSAVRTTTTTTSVPANGSLSLGTFTWSTALNTNGNFFANATVEYTTATKGTSFAVVENITSTTVDIRLINPTGTADTADRRVHAMGYSDYL